MILKVAAAPGPGTDPDLRWWRGYSVLPIQDLRDRLHAHTPCVEFDYHSGIEVDPPIARERLYDFIHEAEELGHAVEFYEMEPGEFGDLSEPEGGWECRRVPVANVLNSLRSCEIIEYQTKYHDEAHRADYDPERHANDLAAARAQKWRAAKRHF